MKTNKLLLSAIAALFFFSCSGPAEVPVDLAGAKEDFVKLIDQYHATMKAKDAAGQMALLADDGVYCGTDPGEIFNKKVLSDYMTKAFADTALMIDDYAIATREIKVDDGGDCAFVVDQFLLKPISATIPVRLTAHAVKQDGKWILDFTSLALIPENKSMAKVSEAAK